MRHLRLPIMLLVLSLWSAWFLQLWAGSDHLVRVFTMPDGTVRIVHPAPADQRFGESDADFFARAMARTLEANPAFAGRPFVDVMASTLPSDRTKRHAWREKQGKIDVDERPSGE